MEISKDLLSAVLGYEVLDILTGRLTNNCDILYITNDGETKRRYRPYFPSINIYELAHKCKEWAYTQDFVLDSRTTNIGVCFVQSSPYFFDEGETVTEEVHKIFRAETEPEAVIKACEWILAQTKSEA